MDRHNHRHRHIFLRLLQNNVAPGFPEPLLPYFLRKTRFPKPVDLPPVLGPPADVLHFEPESGSRFRAAIFDILFLNGESGNFGGYTSLERGRLSSEAY
jgi:hypothetical protein